MLELLTNIGIIAGGLVGLGVIWQKGIRPLYRTLKRVEKVHSYILVELPEWQTKIDHGLKQLYPNGGSSIKDVVDATSRDVSELREMIATHVNNLDLHRRETEHHNLP